MLLSALLLAVVAVLTGCSRRTVGLSIRIAGLGHCGDVRDIVLEVLPDGALKLNSAPQRREGLAALLDEIFTHRAYKYVFVKADPTVSFGDVAEVIDIAAKHVDYVALVTPSISQKATYREEGTCLNPNLPRDRFPEFAPPGATSPLSPPN